MCEHCNLTKCSILNKKDCPINVLWENARQADAIKADLLKQAEAIIRDNQN